MACLGEMIACLGIALICRPRPGILEEVRIFEMNAVGYCFSLLRSFYVKEEIDGPMEERVQGQSSLSTVFYIVHIFVYRRNKNETTSSRN